MNTEVTFVGYFVILLIYNVESEECPLHTCFNCTVFCVNSKPTLYSEQSTQSECVNLLTSTSIISVEYNSKSQCYTSDAICMTYNSEHLGGVAFTYRCTEGCTTYALSGKTNLMVYGDSYTQFPILPDNCIEYCIRTNRFVFDVLSLNNTCRLYDVCEIDYSCTYKKAPISGVMTLKRTCIIPCDPPIALMNGYVEFQSGTTLIYGAVVSYVCNTGYLLEGPTHSTCSVDGTWLPDAPLCLVPSTSALVSTSTHITSSSAPETTGTTLRPTTATSTTEASPTTSTSTTEASPTTSTATTEASPTTSTATTEASPTTSTATTEASPTTSTATTEASPTTATSTTEASPTTSTATTEASPTTTTSTTTVISPLSNKTTAPVVITPIFLCPCLCNTVKWTNMTPDDIISELIKEIAIDPKLTTLAKSKLLSMPDSRMSSKIIGVSGAAILCSCIVVCISCDVFKYVLKWNVIVKKKK